MELSARDSTNKMVAIVIVALLLLLTLSLISTIFLVVQNVL
jgi:conjugal transfer pilus assembly protein TraE